MKKPMDRTPAPDLARRTERRTVDPVPAGPAPADVADHQLQRPADRRVGPVALAEHVVARVHADAGGQRAVHDDQRAREVRRAQQAVGVEGVGAGGRGIGGPAGNDGFESCTGPFAGDPGAGAAERCLFPHASGTVSFGMEQPGDDCAHAGIQAGEFQSVGGGGGVR